MNCDEYRETIAADPSFDGGAGHLSECAACRAYRREMLELDQAIGRALAATVAELEQQARALRVRFSLDVDPQDTL